MRLCLKAVRPNPAAANNLVPHSGRKHETMSLVSTTIRTALSSRPALALILLVCLALRAGLSVREAPRALKGDAIIYVGIARHIVEGRGFSWGTEQSHQPTAHGNFVYPVFLAALFKLFGIRFLPVLIVQSLLDTITCWLVFLMALRLSGSRFGASLAALLYASYPPFIISSAWLYTETLTILLLTPSIYLSWLSFRGRTWYAVAAGALMGLVVLIRPAMLVFPAFAALGYWLARRDSGDWAGKAAAYVLVCYVVVSPWTLRNYLVFGRFIPVSTHGGQTFYAGTGPADGLCLADALCPLVVRGTVRQIPPDAVEVSPQTYRKMMDLRRRLLAVGEADRDILYRKAGLREIAEHPGRYALLAVRKFFILWFNVARDLPPGSPPGGLLSQIRARPVYNLLLIVLAVLGAARGCVDRGFSRLVLLLAVYTSLVTMVAFSVVRYSYPVFPFIIVLASAFLSAGKSKAEAEHSVADGTGRKLM